MSEQEETTGTEEIVQPTESDMLTAEERGDVEESTEETELIEVTLLGKITWKDGAEGEVIGFVASPEAEWAKEPPKVIVNGETGEFDIKGEIADGQEITGTIHMAGDINLYFDMNGEENHASSSQMIGPTISAQITQGAHAVAEWVISR